MSYKNKEDQQTFAKKHYLLNKELYKERAKESKQRLREWFKEYKSTLSCIKCGENHPACIEFHHRNPEEKEYNITTLWCWGSKKKILAEIAKCDVLCANCHAKEHYPRMGV